MDIKRAYRFRFYPTPEQATMLARTFGCARFVYNRMLQMRTDAWQQRQARVGYHETSAALTALKKTPEHGWLNEEPFVESVARRPFAAANQSRPVFAADIEIFEHGVELIFVNAWSHLSLWIHAVADPH